MERETIEAGGAISVIDHGGSGKLIVCVHGLEGSAYNWNLIGPELAETHRVVAPDLSGFGYTAPIESGTTVEANTDLVADVIRHYGTEAILIGNSMGGLISILTAEKYPELVRGLVLLDPAAPVTQWLKVSAASTARLTAPLIPGIGARLIEAYRDNQTAEAGVEESMDFVAFDPDLLDVQVWDDALEIAALRRIQPWATKALIDAGHSIAPYVLNRRRFSPILHKLSQPTLLIHGMEDRLIQVQTARWIARQRPDWTAVFLRDVGHVPMLEAPLRVLQIVDAWLDAAFGEPLLEATAGRVGM